MPEMHPPVNDPVVTSPFGDTRNRPAPHDGIDYVCRDRSNRQVFAIWDGQVCHDMDWYEASKAWTDSRHSLGNLVIIKHVIDGLLYYVRYGHMEKNYVDQGQKVKRGQNLGFYGNVGMSRGAHIHLDMYDYQWKKIDPTPVLEKYGVIAR